MDVPEGSVADVLDWVGDDVDRARAALDAERGRSKPRAGVTGPLGALVGVPAEETIGPFDDDRYIPSLGVHLAAGQTVTVKNGEVEDGS